MTRTDHSSGDVGSGGSSPATSTPIAALSVATIQSRRRAGERNLVFDAAKVRQEAKTRWLKPAEILNILTNYKTFGLTDKTPRRPPSGSLILYDRKVHRYFRNDGHSWRRRKDEKTIAEAHERLKIKCNYVLNCYYAHGDQNQCLQRRIYWMLEEEYSHIALVHYREVPERNIISAPNQNGIIVSNATIDQCCSPVVKLPERAGMCSHEDQLESTLPVGSSTKVTDNQWFNIRCISPEWAFSFESTKVIIVGNFLSEASDSTWGVSFGNVEVPLEIIQEGVIVCKTPPHDVGKVDMYITDGKGKCCSEVLEFLFRSKAEVSSSTSKLSQESSSSPLA